MLRAMQMKCSDQPVTFYDTIILARSQRAAVREKVLSLAGLVKTYRDGVETIRMQVQAKTGSYTR